jgi:hypothetical protein
MSTEGFGDAAAKSPPALCHQSRPSWLRNSEGTVLSHERVFQEFRMPLTTSMFVFSKR